MRFSEFKRKIDAGSVDRQAENTRAKNLEMLLEIISKVNQSLNLQEVLQLVIKNALKITDFDKGCIFLKNAGSGKLEFVTGMDSDNNFRPADSFHLSYTVVQDVYDTGQSIFIEDALNNMDCRQCKSIVKLELQTIFCAPLQNMSGRIGVIYIDSKKLHSSEDKEIIEIFEIMAAQVTASIINAQLHSDLEKLSQVYTRNILTFMRGDRNRTAAFLGIPRKKLDALLE